MTIFKKIVVLKVDETLFSYHKESLSLFLLGKGWFQSNILLIDEQPVISQRIYPHESYKMSMPHDVAFYQIKIMFVR